MLCTLMAVFCVIRKKFLDRVFQVGELAALAEMFAQWYLIVAGDQGRNGIFHCEARIYAFPRTDAAAIRQSLAEKLPDAEFSQPDPDELQVIGPATSVDVDPDLSIWREVLSNRRLEHVCLLLRMTVRGPIGRGSNRGESTTTLVICGMPSGGALLAKAIWSLGRDERRQKLFGLAAWPNEQKLLEAFESYVAERAQGRRGNEARRALDSMGPNCTPLFVSHANERKIMRITRQLAEHPDEHGLVSFLRRLGIALLSCAVFATIAIVDRDSLLIAALSGIAAAYMLKNAASIVWQKVRRVQRYYRAMRSGLGALYSGPIEYRECDLVNDKTPSLLKYSAEVEAAGASHVCDLQIVSARGTRDGNRFYALGDARVSIGLIRATAINSYFPAMPVAIVSTRFKDGRRHFTMTRPVYRKRSRPEISGRCLIEDEGIDELLALHRREVDRLIDAGAVPVPPQRTAAGLIDEMRREHEENRAAWSKSPYSWGDAVHEAFGICRREYRPR
jgi:hypothetical protein